MGVALALAAIVAIAGFFVFAGLQSTPANATLTIYSGAVQLEQSGQRSFHPAKSGDTLHVGDSVQTSKPSRSAIVFADGSVVRLDSCTDITVKDAQFKNGGYHTEIAQFSGKTWNKVQRLVGGASYKVDGPNNSTAEVRGTTFSVLTNVCGSQPGVKPAVSYDTFAGSIDVTAANQKVTVNTGFHTDVTAPATPPSAPVPIPPGEANDLWTVTNQGQDANPAPAPAQQSPAQGQITPGTTVVGTETQQGNGVADITETLYWPGSCFTLTATLDGADFESVSSCTPPSTIVLAKAQAGTWGYWVRNDQSGPDGDPWAVVIGVLNPSQNTPSPFFTSSECGGSVTAGQTATLKTPRARSSAGPPALTVTPSLPSWASFTDDKDGTGSFTFSPPAGLASTTLNLTLTASVGGGSAALSCTETVAGKPQVSSIGGHVSAGTAGVSGVTLTLTSPDASVQTTTTDGAGAYGFYALGAGTYTVAETVPSGYTATSPTSLDETVDGINPVLADFSIAAQPSPPAPPAPPAPASSISGHVTAGGQGVAGVTLTLSGTAQAQSSRKAAIGPNPYPYPTPTPTATPTPTPTATPTPSPAPTPTPVLVAVTSTTTTDAAGAFSFGGLAAGKYTVTESVPSGYLAIGPASLTDTVDGVNAASANFTLGTMSIASSANPSVYGQSPSFTATVLANSPTGAVAFFVDGAGIGSAPLSGSQASIASPLLTVGSHQVSASYAGDATNPALSSPVLVQTVGQGATVTQLTSAPNPALVTQTVNLTATVAVSAPAAGTPTGTVAFKDGTATLATVTLSSGQASYATSWTSAGTHSLTAVYSGDSGFAGSTSPVVYQQVNLKQVALGGPGTLNRFAGGPGYGSSDISLSNEAIVGAPAPGGNGHYYVYIADDNDETTVRRYDSATGLFTEVASNNGYDPVEGIGGPASQAELCDITGLAVAPDGSLYMADYCGGGIEKVDFSTNPPTVSMVAGCSHSTSQNYYLPACAVSGNGDGGPAVGANLGSPDFIASDPTTGDLYVVDSGRASVRKIAATAGVISSSSIITTVAGGGATNGACSAGRCPGDGGAATAAGLTTISGIAVDASGNLYIAVAGLNNTTPAIRMVNAAGVISTVAGGSAAGYSGDGGPAASAQLDFASALAISFDASGDLLLADNLHSVVRKIAGSAASNPSITQLSTISTIAGTGTGSGHCSWYQKPECPGDGGPAAGTPLIGVWAVGADPAGNVYFGDDYSAVVRRIDSAGNLSSFVGNEFYLDGGNNGPALAAQLDFPEGVTHDAAGNVYIADTYNHVVRKVDIAGNTTVVAGQRSVYGYNTTPTQYWLAGAACPAAGDGVLATQACLYQPAGVAVDSAGNLYIADKQNGRVREVAAATGLISTVATLSGPYGLAVDSAGGVYVSTSSSPPAVYKIGAGGSLTRVAGGGSTLYVDGGPATGAQLGYPIGLAFDAAGNLYFSDYYQYCVRMVDAQGLIHTVAGVCGTYGLAGDGGPAKLALLERADGIAFDAAGNLYIADDNTGLVRKVDTAGNIGSVAGVPTVYDIGQEGLHATISPMEEPDAVTVDGSGNLYVTDYHDRLFVIPSGRPQSACTAQPEVYSVYPAVGAAAGGAGVTIKGGCFLGATSVTFTSHLSGKSVSEPFTFVDDSTITTTAPAGTVGDYDDVQVTTAAGTSPLQVPCYVIYKCGSYDQYKYQAAPAISLASGAWNSGLTPGATTFSGTLQNLWGSGFTGTTQVQAGGLNAPWFHVVSDSEIQFMPPARTPQPTALQVSVTVVTPAGSVTGGTLTYEGAPVITSVSRTLFSTDDASNAVTVTGQNLAGLTGACLQGPTSCSFVGVTSDSATTIQAYFYGNAPNQYWLNVTTPAGATGQTAQDTVTLVLPEWTWNGSAWSETVTATAPGPATQEAMAYEPGTGTVILALWRSTGAFETWRWDGSLGTWSKLSPATSPSTTTAVGPGFAFDGGSQLITLDSTGNTWSWNGTTWTVLLAAGAGPHPANAQMLTYDQQRNAVFAYDGNAAWYWTGSAWSQYWSASAPSPSPSPTPTPAPGPAARFNGAVAYDPTTKDVVLFGGSNGTTYYNDTWLWNGSGWTQATAQAAAGSPAARSFASIAIDPSTSKVVLFGGSSGSTCSGGPYNDTWEWSGSAWSQKTTSVQPPARCGAGLAADTKNNVDFLFGGTQIYGVSMTAPAANYATAAVPIGTGETANGPAHQAPTRHAPGPRPAAQRRASLAPGAPSPSATPTPVMTTGSAPAAGYTATVLPSRSVAVQPSQSQVVAHPRLAPMPAASPPPPPPATPVPAPSPSPSRPPSPAASPPPSPSPSPSASPSAAPKASPTPAASPRPASSPRLSSPPPTP